jgi:glycosyltransferase involved in cell wall biosynthesis
VSAGRAAASTERQSEAATANESVGRGLRIGYDTLVESPVHPSSAIHYIEHALRAMVRLGPEHEFFVFVSRKNRARFAIDAPNVHYVLCAASNENIPLRILIQQFWYPVLARRLKLDAIHAVSQIPLMVPCATVVKTCGLHHHLQPAEYLKKVPFWRRLVNPLRLVYRHIVWDASARRSTFVMANTNTTKRDIARLMHVPESKIQVVLEAVDDRFRPAEDPADAARRVKGRFGLARPYILYVSNLWFYKNPDGAIGAFGRLRARFGDDVDMVIAGPDDFKRIPTLRDLAAKEGVADRVHFLGRVGVPDLVTLYAAARVLFYPSYAETFGKPVVEGMRSGVPVVAADRTCLPEVVGDAGILVDPDDLEAMGDALHRALTDEALRIRLIALGLERAKAFSWDAVGRGTLELLTRAVATHRRSLV